MKNPINHFGKNYFVSSSYCTLEISYETSIYKNYTGGKDPKPIKTNPSDMYYGAIRIIEGSCNLIANNQNFHLVKGDLLFIKYFKGFQFVSNNESCKYFFHWFYLNNISVPFYQVFNIPISPQEFNDSKSIIHLLQENNFNSSHIANGYMQILLFSWLKSIDISTQTQSSKLFSDIQNYIITNLSITLTVNEIAKHFYFSTKYINSIINKNIGTSPKKYIKRLIMEKSVLLLDKTNLNISQIAYELGFSDASSFSATFKKYFHYSPLTYRVNMIRNHDENKLKN